MPAFPQPRGRRNGLRALFVALIVVAAVGAVLAWRRPDVLVLGDSITEWGAGDVGANLRWRYDVHSVGHAGYRIDEMLPDARAEADGRPERVIVNLGSNDALLSWPLDRSEAALREMVGLFPTARCFSLVTVNETMAAPGVDAPANAVALNAVIRTVAAERHATVIDWAAAVREHLAASLASGVPQEPSARYTIDLVHPTALGYEKLSSMYADAMAPCG